MKNLLKLSLLFTSLLTLTHRTDSESDVIVKNNHRIAVVEFNKDGKTNIEVVISPPRKINEEEKLVLNRNVKRKVRETTSFSSLQNNIEYKHKMSSMLKRFKDQTVETARDISNEARDVEESVSVWEIVKSVVRCIVSVVGLMGISAAYGTCVWVTFVSSYVLGLVLGRHQYGVVKTKVYPVYFKVISVWILVGLLGHVLSQKKKILTDAVEMWQAVNLLTSLLMVEANASFVESRATKMMFELMKVEKEEGRGCLSCDEKVKQRLMELNKRLRRFNAYSSWLNSLTFLSLTWHFVYLGQRLSAIC